MSDHLIAEANRHAKALTDERNNLVVELKLLREWQREVIQNARAHHAERKDAIARAERAEAELKEWSRLNLWGGTPGFIHAFIKRQQARIHAAQDIEVELAAEQARLDWLEKRGPWESWNGFGETGITLRENIRDGIDAAMKEDAK